MRKLLSILMFACLLWGMVLPAAAEGEESPTPVQLYAQTGESTDFLEGLSFEAGQSLSVRIYVTNTSDSAVITTAEGFTPQEGLTVSAPDDKGNRTLSCETAGTYTLRYTQDETNYSMTITVTSNTITVSDVSALNEALSEQTKFDEFLLKNHYGGIGNLTLVLPKGTIDSIACGNVSLSDNATLTLKGASEGTTMPSLTIGAENVSVDGIAFNGVPSITTNAACAVSNCTFKLGNGTDKYAFQLQQDASGNVPILTLSGNTFSSLELVKIVDSGDNEIGRWRVQTKTTSEPVDVDFSVVVGEMGTETTLVNVLGDKKDLVDAGWQFAFETDRGYDKAYVVYDGGNVDSTSPNAKIQFIALQRGIYSIVKGTGPEAEKNDAATKTVTISANQQKHLRKATVDCDFQAVKVTDNKGNDVNWNLDSDGNLTITLNGNSPYTIKDVSTTTTTTTKTTAKTTSRRYTTSTQDYFLVTPAGFSNAMRYVKDDLVTIDCTQAGRKSISLPVDSMAAAAEKGYNVLVKAPNAELTLDAAALKSLSQQAKGTTVLLHYQSLNHKTLTTVGQASVRSYLAKNPNDYADLAFLVTATSDSETIEDLQQGSVTLRIPFIVLPGTEDKENVVCALQGETVTDVRETTVADGYLTARLLDLTEHMVFQIGEPVETTEETTEAAEETTVETTLETTQPETEATQPPETEETDKGFPVWIPVVVVLLLAGGGAAVWFLYLGKRFKK